MVLAFLAGALSTLNPCVLPILPVLAASSLDRNRFGPLSLTAGLVVSFTVAGVGVYALGLSIGLSPDSVRYAGAVLAIGFGFVLMSARLQTRFASTTGGIGERAGMLVHQIDDSGPGGQFVGGLLLGVIWTPCSGPTLGAAIALAAQGGSVSSATMTMLAFGLGAASVLLAVAYGARQAVALNRHRLLAAAALARPVMGGAFILLGIAVLLGWDKSLEGLLLDTMPQAWSDLTIRY